MRSDEDLLAYASARWPVLVRTLVLLGCPEADAPEVATDALSRCRREWAGTSRDGDVDTLVYAELLAAWHRHARARGLAPEADEDHVLTGYAGLGAARPDPDLHERAEEVRPGPPPTLDDLETRARARRRVATRRALAVAVPLVLVLVGLTWWTTRDSAPDRPDRAIGPARVVQDRNVLPTAWWADGQLHLAATRLRIPDLHDLTALGPGAVYGDTGGRVVSVSDDGSRRVLGHKDPRLPVVAGDETGWVAWIDTERRAIRVQDAYGSRAVGALPLALTTGTARLVALDGTTVYFRDGAGGHAWLPDGDADGEADVTSVTPVSPSQLEDVRSRIRVFQAEPSTIQVVQSAFNVAYLLPGYGARLSPDGNTVATRLDESRYGRLAVYDTRSGQPVDLGLGDDEAVLSFTFGLDDTITLAVARVADMSRSGPFLRDFTGGTVELRSCDLDARTGPSCTVPVELGDQDDVPVLAR